MDGDEALELDDNEFDLDESGNGEDDDDNQFQGYDHDNPDMDDGDDDDNDEDQDDDDQDDDQPQPNFPKSSGFNQPGAGSSPSKGKNDKPFEEVKKVENQPHDMEFELDDSEEIDTEEEQDHVQDQPTKAKVAAATAAEDQNEDDVVGAYNAADYAHLNVSNEVRELFEYIGRYKPQRIELDTTFRPFIPEFIPNIGEVDAFLKMPKPDGSPETLGIEVLDEPALNTADKAVLEMKYIQLKKTTKAVAIKVHSIENAEKRPKEIQNWIKNVNELNSSRPPPTVNYSKPMPDFDKLMEEWPPAIEQVLREIPFPGPDLEVSTGDYAKLISTMLDVPVHSTKSNKGLIEALHVIFTLYSDFKSNIHFQKQEGAGDHDDPNTQSMAF